MKNLAVIIILNLFPITAGNSQNTHIDTVRQREFNQIKKEVDSLQIQKNLSYDLLEYQIDH